MSSFSRLWRRAPIWRFCLVSAIAFTGLATMFPTALPSWFPNRPLPSAPGFTLQPEAAPPAYGQLDLPPPGPGRSGVIPFSGHRLPLPAGAWQNLVMAQGSGALAVQVELLARVEDAHLTGIVLAAAPSPLSHYDRGTTPFSPCYATNAIAHQIIPVPGANPLAHECWILSAVSMAGGDVPLKHDEVLRRGLDRLQRMGVAVPDHMLLLSYLRADETGWFTVILLLPDHGEAPRRKVAAWARQFAPLFHKGYENSLLSADLSGVARDPG